VLADAVVEVVRNLTGYDRVVVYKFDPDGHGKVIAEARTRGWSRCWATTTRPATSRSARARCTCSTACACWWTWTTRRRRRCCPRCCPAQAPLDMSLCQLRSMSPIHLQYLRNMGVTDADRIAGA
jgi:light-regulated signal transduction histidine kinase (bacteriophytochrome)